MFMFVKKVSLLLMSSALVNGLPSKGEAELSESVLHALEAVDASFDVGAEGDIGGEPFGPPEDLEASQLRYGRDCETGAGQSDSRLDRELQGTAGGCALETYEAARSCHKYWYCPEKEHKLDTCLHIDASTSIYSFALHCQHPMMCRNPAKSGLSKEDGAACRLPEERSQGALAKLTRLLKPDGCPSSSGTLAMPGWSASTDNKGYPAIFTSKGEKISEQLLLLQKQLREDQEDLSPSSYFELFRKYAAGKHFNLDGFEEPLTHADFAPKVKGDGLKVPRGGLNAPWWPLCQDVEDAALQRLQADFYAKHLSFSRDERLKFMV